ncbi:35738_t:CDS:2 [Gigaspora margarita]|uniref:35738_t:CDS:1 n=1 Tax=Gigaspora margarita TaxID=4874 RepID=A0ABN7V5Z1_GIGMA|nr:35738_t:CDS:2 [Gigaspora margarita]
MSNFHTKKGLSIILLGLLFLILTGAVRIDLKRRDFTKGLGESCSNDDECHTKICRIADQDSPKCQLTDTRDNGQKCLNNVACKSQICDPVSHICEATN